MKSKIAHVWSILCEKSIIDSESNNLSLTNVLEEIQITPKEKTAIDSEEKIVPINFEFVTMWRRIGEGEVKEPIKIEIVDPNGRVIQSADAQIDLARSLNRMRFRFRFNGMKATVPGDYCFVVKLKQGNIYKEVGKTYLEVKIVIPTTK